MVLDYMFKIYEDPQILEYLRFHPKWYKILYYDSSRVDEFLNEAKTNLRLRVVDKLDDLKDKITFIRQFADFIR